MPNITKIPTYRKTVSILNIESPDCFYVTLPEWLELRNNLSKDMKLHYAETELEHNVDWNIGDKCAILSAKANAWYRGIVTNVSDTKITVFLKDIATTEQIPYKDVYHLHETFLSTRDLAIRCSLAGLIPAGGSEKWTQTSIQEFKDLVQYHTELFITKQGNIVNKSLPVFLYATWEEIGGPLDPAIKKNLLINKKLIEKGVALPAKGFTFEETKSSIIIENDPFETKLEELKKEKPKDWLPPPPFTKKKFKAKVSYVDHDGYVYLHDIQLENNLLQMKQVLNKNFLATSPEPQHPWVPEQMCTVQYHLDKSYYRASVLETLPDGQIKVRFIDYGNEETCTHNELRSVVMLIMEPMMASKCNLYNVEPKTSDGKWPVPLLDKLHQTVVDQTVDIEIIGRQIKDEPVDIVLTLKSVNINIQVMTSDWSKLENEEIKGTLLEDDDDVLIEGSITSETSDKATDWVTLANLEQKREQVKFKYIDLPATKTFEAVVINVLDHKTLVIEGTFNIDLIKDTGKEFDKLSQELNELGPLQPVIFEPVVGEACCTEFEDDNNWYRAEIYSTDMMNETKTVQVLFVDYGNVDFVPREKVRKLKEEWINYPVQQLQCRIWGIEKSESVDCLAAQKYLSDILLDKRFLLIVKEMQPVLQVTLLDIENSCLAYQPAIDEGIYALTE